MRDAQEREALAASEGESPEDFLADLRKALCKESGIDIGLAEILATHLLTAAPSANAVAKAKDAILRLASERAANPAFDLQVHNG